MDDVKDHADAKVVSGVDEGNERLVGACSDYKRKWEEASIRGVPAVTARRSIRLTEARRDGVV